MDPFGYEVEFIPLERRLQQRRTQSSGSSPIGTERRERDRRVAASQDSATTTPLNHSDARRAA